MKINYDSILGLCISQCPYQIRIRIGSDKCTSCEHYGGMDIKGEFIECHKKEDRFWQIYAGGGREILG